MKTITFTTEQIANHIIASYSLVKEGFKTKDEHLNDCRAIRSLVGDEFYHEAAEIAKSKAQEN